MDEMNLKCGVFMVWFLSMLSRFGANLAGWIWNGGNAAQFLVGAVTWTPWVVLASLLNIGSSTCWAVVGHKNWGARWACVLGVCGTGITVREGLMRLDGAICAAFFFFIVAASFGYFSDRLAVVYGGAESWVVRQTLGTPRRMMAFLLVCFSRLPIIYHSVQHAQWDVVLPFLIWMTGDIVFGFSKPEKRDEVDQVCGVAQVV